MVTNIYAPATILLRALLEKEVHVLWNNPHRAQKLERPVVANLVFVHPYVHVLHNMILQSRLEMVYRPCRELNSVHDALQVLFSS